MQIQSLQKQYYGHEMNLPIDGKVTIGEDGMVEVSDKCAALLLPHVKNWVNPVTEEEDEAPAKAAPKKKAVVKATNEQLLSQVDTMELQDLLDLCAAAGVKGYEKLSGNLKALRSLVKNQLAKAGK